MAEGYCVKDKKKVEIQNAERIAMKNGRRPRVPAPTVAARSSESAAERPDSVTIATPAFAGVAASVALCGLSAGPPARSQTAKWGLRHSCPGRRGRHERADRPAGARIPFARIGVHPNKSEAVRLSPVSTTSPCPRRGRDAHPRRGRPGQWSATRPDQGPHADRARSGGNSPCMRGRSP